ncbi:MAG TPA: hypothetical protein VII95_10200, partial [Terriglobales bacterium]
AQSMRPGSVCRHLKIAGRVPISQFFHVTSQQPRKLQHIHRSYCSRLYRIRIRSPEYSMTQPNAHLLADTTMLEPQ